MPDNLISKYSTRGNAQEEEEIHREWNAQ